MSVETIKKEKKEIIKKQQTEALERRKSQEKEYLTHMSY
jgi:hypothetical protein